MALAFRSASTGVRSGIFTGVGTASQPKEAWRKSLCSPISSLNQRKRSRSERCGRFCLHKAARQSKVQAAATELVEIDKDNFDQVLKEAKDKLVVVDFYTSWCGPCKVIYPQLVELQNALPEVELVKFNCNEYNKPLAKELGIRVAPTFKLYKNGTKVAEVTGAKVDALKELIEMHK